MTKPIERRAVLRSTTCGVAVSLGLPFMDCFLNVHGTALAASGTKLPVVFGTWWQGLGFTPGRWIPKKVGANYENNVELKAFDPFRDRMNIISGTKYFLDGRPVETHTTGWQIAATGAIPIGGQSGPSLDMMIADVIGKTTRFRSLEVSLDGSRGSFSNRSGSVRNPSEPSPVALYARIFGPEFKDPNAAEFTPSPAILARQSVLSYLKDERQQIMGMVGASDRARLDEYFTSLRQIEQQLDIELQKPAPLESCVVPGKPEEAPPRSTIGEVAKNNKLFGALLAHAVACGQTQVFNVVLGSGGLRKPGDARGWHQYTHDEPVDDSLGYQREVTSFIDFANGAFVDFLRELDGMREGAGSVLDRTVIVWQTDHGYARTHTMDNLPILTVGSAGGRLRTGLHVSAPGDPATRVGLTLQQALGVPIQTWGALSNETSKTMTDILA